ncbi:cysteine methyltransferase [Solibacillus sp. MA9]|uniref:Cysteine methyltransferase n=1 Tax=Solibacillus palustris TaxID=2908203 RepID=A0ABS9UDP3_9BACL|nr:cysteine methyltransferase [Solibacillus sp. MA9]MCH7322466.1 cysteine methyltransferase [Solibacillus sp. MA9]
MLNSDAKQSTLYLAADDMMQIHLSVQKIRDLNKDEFSFAIRTFCYVEQDEEFAQNLLFKLILGISKQGQGMTLAVDLVNIPNIFPLQLKNIIEHIQKSPMLLESLYNQLSYIQKSDDYEKSLQAQRAKEFLLDNLSKGITSFSTNRQATEMIWLTNQNHNISNISPFLLDEKGGHIQFTVQIGFKHSYMMQCYEVDCMMHMFNESEKLGYYFELYLDQENYHHQLMYEKLPDQFMDNQAFLQQILTQMKKRNEEQYDEYLHDLIEKFTASI